MTYDKEIDDFNERIDKTKDDLIEKGMKSSNDRVCHAYFELSNKYEFARRVFNQFFEDGTIRVDD